MLPFGLWWLLRRSRFAEHSEKALWFVSAENHSRSGDLWRCFTIAHAARGCGRRTTSTERGADGGQQKPKVTAVCPTRVSSSYHKQQPQGTTGIDRFLPYLELEFQIRYSHHALSVHLLFRLLRPKRWADPAEICQQRSAFDWQRGLKSSFRSRDFK